MKRYALKGINDEKHECAVCGKVELKRVMWLVELDADGNETGEAFHCGTTCGAKLLGYTASKMATKVKGFDGEVQRKRDGMFWNHSSTKTANAVMAELNKLTLTFAERQAHPLYVEYKRLVADARTWADAQPVAIEL